VYNVSVAELIGHIILGTVIQEVRTSNVAREVGTLQALHWFGGCFVLDIMLLTSSLI